MVVLLAGGTGGAKLARGLLDETDELTVIANTADDVEIYGAHVSPDPDLITFWLADRIDERGWGLAGDSFHVMDGLRELGDDVWFNLGDRDLALCIRRARRLAEGARLTEAIDEARRALGVRARVLPMSDQPVRTHVKARGTWHPFQEFMIRERAAGPVEDVELRGLEDARPTPEVLEAIANAEADRHRPLQPGDLDRPDPRGSSARRSTRRPPRRGRARRSCAARRSRARPPSSSRGPATPSSSEGIAAHYAGLLDGLVADERAESVPTLVTDVEMGDQEARRRVARDVLAFSRALAG